MMPSLPYKIKKILEETSLVKISANYSDEGVNGVQIISLITQSHTQ